MTEGKKFKVGPATRGQWVMVILMAVFWASALFWAYPEMLGVLSDATEDTYSEWVWDLPFWATAGITLLHVIGGVLLLGSAWHFLEGWGRRRRIEKGEDIRG